jgi:ADP-ribosylation factor GTPase-activating protein 1
LFDTVLRKQLGGNEAFKDFMSSYGADGGYSPGMGMIEKYNSWAATQYREKVCC